MKIEFLKAIIKEENMNQLHIYFRDCKVQMHWMSHPENLEQNASSWMLYILILKDINKCHLYNKQGDGIEKENW